MSGGMRLERGGRIDRTRPLRFRFDDQALSGFAGDTLASALLANGVRVAGRSFKLHRPRGIFAAGLEEPNVLVTVGEGAFAETNQKATEVPLYDGLIARSVNVWPNASRDLGGLLAPLRRLLPAGFYYKTFMWPYWNLYEPLIRHLAGLGRTTTEPDPDRYDKRFAECEVLVVGSGPAGLTAALEAARAGRQVLLVEADFELGGSLLAAPTTATGEDSGVWLERTLGELRATGKVALRTQTLAFGYYDHNCVSLLERIGAETYASRPTGAVRRRLWNVRCAEVVLASGAFERPLLFPDNDRPGVMLASAAATYAHRFAVRPGRAVVIATNNDSGYDSAQTLLKAGVKVRALVDSRAQVTRRGDFERLGVEVISGHVVTRVAGARGVKRIEVAPWQEFASAAKWETRELEADVLCTAGGWTPAVHLFSQSGGRLRFDPELEAFRPDARRQNVRVVGAANGDFTRAAAFASKTCVTVPIAFDRQWVDLQNDVTVADVRGAASEGYASVEHLKRYTTTGMAVDQGKTSNLNALSVLGESLGREIAQVGTTTFRPPFSPVTFGALAGQKRGRLLMPLRRLPAHDNHAALCAQFANFGGWLRPECYRRAGESFEDAVRREALAARRGCALFDGSPLGKIEVRGPDAAKFLSRFYINSVADLAPGRVRYGLMLAESGGIIDDGVFACLAKDHYQVCTTSAGAGRIFAWFEEWQQCEWPDLDVVLLPVTTQYATLTVSGPRARTVVERLGSDIDCSAAAFPHLHVRSGKLDGLPLRIFRVSYTGEVSFEINFPASAAPALFERLLELGRDQEIVPLGIEALMLLRAEKGYLHVGSDTDALTIPGDVGFGHIAARKQEDFIGKRSLRRAEAVRHDRLQLVGLLAEDPNQVLAVGAQALPELDARPPVRGVGRVTSSFFSPNLGRSIALALIERGRARHGETVALLDQGTRHRARIVEPVFHDPSGALLRG